MPAALTFPIGSRFYDWKYESEPEPHMYGRRIYHARGKVLGGSSQHQRHDLPARQPARLRALGRRPRHGDVGLRPLPAVLQDGWRTACPARDEPSEATTARSCSSGARRRTRCSGRSSMPTEQAGYPLTEDVNGYRAGGLRRFDRNISPRSPPQRRAARTCTRCMDRPNLEVINRRAGDRRVSSSTARGARGVESGTHRGGGQTKVVTAGEVVLCGGAINSPQLLQLSGVGNAAELRAARHRRSCTTFPAWASTSRTISRCTSSTRAPSPSPWQPMRNWWRRPSSARSGCSRRRGPGATNHFEAGGFVRSNDEVEYPNLMFHFLPIAIRYDGSSPAERPRVPGARRADVLGLAGLGEDHLARSARQAGAAVQLPVDRPGPAGVGRGDARRARNILDQPAFAPFNGGEISPGRRSRPTRRSSTGCAATARPRCTRRARAGWAWTTCRWWTR